MGKKLTSADLFNPDLNIKIGIKYISSLRQDFNNEMLAIASYNAGLGNVKKWKEKIFNGDYDDFVEEIPFLETKTYVKKVFASFWNYRRIY
jgi:soluble lytic murein transglycosylase